MTAAAPPVNAAPPDFDVVVVGAGISGLGMATHLRRRCPQLRFAVLEQRDAIGGTWDLFRYPGVRSDSDMHSLGFAFAPWRDPDAIAGGDKIRAYLERVVADEALAPHIRLGHKVLTADWDGATARWLLEVETAGGARTQLRCRFLFLGSGYFDYDEPYQAELPGITGFGGTVVHPQFWPRDLDYDGKRVVVIGSGATAATIVPAMAQRAAHVTMLQRTPSWYFSRPSRDALASALRKVLPERWAYALTRGKSVLFQHVTFRRARKHPEKTAGLLTSQVRSLLGKAYDPIAFTPPYKPWEQRLCLVPDGDLFKAMRAGRASIVTDRIAGFDAGGVQLASGRHLPADLVVTATGLKLALAGKIAVSLGGEPVRWNQHYYYRNCMFSNVPNFAAMFGYINAAWTLRVDTVAPYLCRVLNHLDRTAADVVVPVLAPDARLEDDEVLDFSSGYLERSRHLLPKSATTLPWRLNQDYLFDRKDMPRAPLDDGILRFACAPLSEVTGAPPTRGPARLARTAD